jgi:cytochrome c-type biogenesis protein CcmH
VKGGLAWILVAITPAAALADSPLQAAPYANTQLADPVKESAAKALMESIRCLVCQGQSIADSDAELAGDMRSLIRRRIESGEQPAAIRSWLIERYGNWVTYDPPFSGLTAPLILAPFFFLGLGLVMVRRRLKLRRV